MKLNKKASRSIAIALVGVSMITPIVNTSYAMENSNSNILEINKEDLKIKTIEDTDEKKVVEVMEGEKISTSTFNKKDNTLKLEIKENGKIIQDSYINLNNDNNIQNYIEPRATRAQESVRCIYSKLRYSINMKSWTITNSKGSVKKRPETVSHKDYLYRFRDAVKASRRSENLAEASMGAAKIAAIYGIVTAATGVGAVVSVVTAAGGSLGAAYNLWDSVIEKREADRYFAIL